MPATDKDRYELAEPCTEDRGMHYCGACRSGFRNNMEASSHLLDHPSHELFWWCIEHGPERNS